MITSTSTTILRRLPLALALIAGGGLALVSCQSGNTGIPTETDCSPAPPPGSGASDPASKDGATFFRGYYPDAGGLERAWVMESVDGNGVVEGDIVLGDARDLKIRGRLLQNVHAPLWSRAVVPYDMVPDYPARRIAEQAMRHISDRTVIQFRPRTASDRNYIVYTVSNDPKIGGRSRYGMVGGAQPLWLNPSTANTGTAIHELGHALGFAHEQNRRDRDQYIRVNYQNIDPDYHDQFEQLFGAGRDIGSYDYSSIMHYGREAFSNGNGDSMTPLQNCGIGNRSSLSSGDITGINETYRREVARR